MGQSVPSFVDLAVHADSFASVQRRSSAKSLSLTSLATMTHPTRRRPPMSEPIVLEVFTDYV